MGVPYKLYLPPRLPSREDLAEHPPFAEKLSGVACPRGERRRAPDGPALDLGGGSAVWGVKAAERGRQVTGIDIVEKALERARERVREADVYVRVVTRRRDGSSGAGHRLRLPVGA